MNSKQPPTESSPSIYLKNASLGMDDVNWQPVPFSPYTLFPQSWESLKVKFLWNFTVKKRIPLNYCHFPSILEKCFCFCIILSPITLPMIDIWSMHNVLKYISGFPLSLTEVFMRDTSAKGSHSCLLHDEYSVFLIWNYIF